MNRAELEHVIKAAASITADEIVVIGSQASLVHDQGALPTVLRSLEADVYPRNDPSGADKIDAAIGDGSMFHQTWGYYAHGVGPETPKAPAGWEDRLIKLELSPFPPRREKVTAWCLQIHDLALSKLAVGRPKDIAFVIEALDVELVDCEQLLLGLELMPDDLRDMTGERIEIVIARAERS